MSTDYVPSREDRFSFGIWTVGWQGVDVFGPAVRPPMAADRAVRELAELGAYGVNFHDNDVFDFGASDAERDKRIADFRTALADTGLVVTTMPVSDSALRSAPIRSSRSAGVASKANTSLS